MEKLQQKVLRAKEVAQYLAISIRTLYRWIEQDNFPKGKKLSKRITVWEVEALDNFLAEKLGEK